MAEVKEMVIPLRAAWNVPRTKRANRAMAEIRKSTADLAIRAAARLVESSLTDKQQHEIVDRFLAETTDGQTGSSDSLH